MLFSVLRNILARYGIYKHRKYVMKQVAEGMRLGQNVMITPGVKFDSPHSFLISIGDNCIVAPHVTFLAHDASTFGFIDGAKIGKITIHDNCFIGAHALLLPGISIGPNAIVGAGSVVTKTIPPDSICAGNPAKVIKKLSTHLDDIKKNWEENKNPLYQSDSFYSRLSSKQFRDKVLQEIDSIGYTRGTDKDFTFHFNTSSR